MFSLRTTVSAILRWPAQRDNGPLDRPDPGVPGYAEPAARPGLPVRADMQPLHGGIDTEVRPPKGLARGLRRFSRCHPWDPGGYDPP